VSGYTIKISQFEGPFELLLFFIEKDELDIYDIPISKITSDFLDYIQHLDELNLDVASEFIVVAANLMRIKAKMLLPRKELDEEGNDIDPREELVSKLIEYKKYRELVDQIRELEYDRSLIFERGNAEAETSHFRQIMGEEIELEETSLFKLLSAFTSIIEKFDDRIKTVTHYIYRYSYTIEDQSEFILERLKTNRKSSFDVIFNGLENRVHAIVTFLAILELLNQQTIGIVQGLGPNNFWLEKNQ